MTVLQTVDGRLLPAEMSPEQSSEYLVISGGHGRVELAGALQATYELIYETNPNCAAVVNKLVRQISTLPIRTYDRPPGEPNPECVPNHPVAKLLANPAPRRGPSYWKQGLARSALVQGNGLLAKWRGPTGLGQPQALLPCSWPYVAAYAPLGSPVEWWSTFQTGTQRFFDVDDGVHLAWESADLHGLGVSPLKQLALTVKTDDASRRYQNASFANGARPAGAIVPPDGFTYKEGQREDFRKEIQNQHSGVDNAFMMALLAPGFTWQPFSHTAVEAELMAARTLNREEFAMVYDIPPPMIGDLTHGTYSNVEELHRILYVTTLRPWLALIEEILQVQLIAAEDGWNDIYVQFDLTTVLRGNRREEIDAAAEAFTNGLMTLNEVRELLELSRLSAKVDPDGMADVPHIPANNLKPLGHKADPPPPQFLVAPTASENPDETIAPTQMTPPPPDKAMSDEPSPGESM